MNPSLYGYFDYAAGTPVDPRVAEAMQPYFSELFYNPSALYKPAREVKKAVENARAMVAMELGARPAEIIFTAGGSEANNLAVRGVMEKYPGSELLISAIEHDSVRALSAKYTCREIDVLPSAIIDIEDLTKKISDNTVLVSVMLANNEVGSIQPIRKISQLIQTVRRARLESGNNRPLYLHTDAAQAANYLELQVHRLGVDLLSLNGGKIYGPKQSGVLFVSGSIMLEPIIFGGGQERSLRSGTENVPGIIGLAEALKIAASMRKDEVERLKELQKYFLNQLETKLPQARVNGTLKARLPNNVHITLPGCDNERVLILLEAKELYAAAGSACSASSEEPSHVLQALGLPEDEIRASLRFTMGRGTNQADIDNLVSSLAAIA